MALTATLKEVLAAQAFLRTLGADWRNQDIVRGVIAWFHQASFDAFGKGKIKGNNIFGLKNGEGKLYSFASLEIAATAAARRLLSGAKEKGDVKGFGLIIRAAKRGVILDFLTAIAISKWDAGFYGYTPEHPENNKLLAQYNKITGLTMPAPPQPKPKKRLFPQHPRDIPAPFAPSPYLDPREVGRLYLERHSNPMGNLATERSSGV